jgi:two-component system NarL family sensor kinase
MNMKLRQRIFWSALVPLFIALCAIAVTVSYQANSLKQQQRESVERAYRDIKDTELKNYSALAEQSIAHLHNSGKSDVATLEEAKTILRNLSYGPNGYFFLFNLEGEMLMHPRQPELVGQNLWELTDDKGDPSVQRLIKQARDEGNGFVEYKWQKPTNKNEALVLKRSYVFILKNWDWVLGTGVYLDDIDTELKNLDEQASRSIRNTMIGIAVISCAGVLLIGFGLVWSIKGRSEVDAQLSELAQRIMKTQEDERSKISSALHDNIKPNLDVIEYMILRGIDKLENFSQNPTAARDKLARAISIVKKTYLDISNVIKGLRPYDLETLGLEGAIRSCARDFSSKTTQVEFTVIGERVGLPPSAEQALFLVAKESIVNAKKHSTANLVSVRLENSSRYVTLTIHDYGCGFDADRIKKDPKCGLGLRNMEERIKAEGGSFTLKSSKSSSSGTFVIAKICLN